MEDLKFTNDGITYQVIATYYDTEYTKKNYIVYTDNTYKDNKLQIYYSLYEKYPNDKIKLIDISNSLEKKVGLSLLKAILEDLPNTFKND